MIANLAAQTVEAHRLGIPVPDQDGHRPWYYIPCQGPLYRAGHLALGGPEPPDDGDGHRSYLPPGEVGLARALPMGEAGLVRALPMDEVRLVRALPMDEVRLVRALPMDGDAAWIMMCLALSRMVGEVRAFTFKQMGFRDMRPDCRVVGGRRPHVVLLVEKESLREAAVEIQRLHGVTIAVSGGVPPLVGTEFLTEYLRAVGVGEVFILSFCDWDPPGWDMPVILSDQFSRYGMPTREIRRLVTPERFTAEELERLAVPLSGQDPRWLGRVRRWVRETGGVNGKAMGLYADYLQPVERVVRAFEDVAAGWLG